MQPDFTVCCTPVWTTGVTHVLCTETVREQHTLISFHAVWWHRVWKPAVVHTSHLKSQRKVLSHEPRWFHALRARVSILPSSTGKSRALRYGDTPADALLRQLRARHLAAGAGAHMVPPHAYGSALFPSGYSGAPENQDLSLESVCSRSSLLL